MRVQSGIYKSRIIKTCTVRSVWHRGVGCRPTKANVRQALFNILQHAAYVPHDFLHNAVMMDVCCGSGSCGIEALSLGARFVLFIDNSLDALNLVQKNLQQIGVEKEKAAVMQVDVTRMPVAYGMYARLFNVVFIDPPYGRDTHIRYALNGLVEGKWINSGAVVVVETVCGGYTSHCGARCGSVGIAESLYDVEGKALLEQVTGMTQHCVWRMMDERVYGKTKLVVLQYSP